MSTLTWVERVDWTGGNLWTHFVYTGYSYIGFCEFSNNRAYYKPADGAFLDEWFSTSSGAVSSVISAAPYIESGDRKCYALRANGVVNLGTFDATVPSTLTLPISQTNNALAAHYNGIVMIVGETDLSIRERYGSYTGGTHTLPATASWRAIAATMAGFVTVAHGTSMSATSEFPTYTWTAGTLPATANWSHLAVYGGFRVFAVANGSTNGAVSEDSGATWTAFTLPASTTWRTVVVWNGRLYLFGASGADFTAPFHAYSAPVDDLTDWETEDLPPDIQYLGGCAVGDSGMVMGYVDNADDRHTIRSIGTTNYSVDLDVPGQTFHVPPFGTTNFALALAGADYPVVMCLKLDCPSDTVFNPTWMFFNTGTTPPTWDTLDTAEQEWTWGDVLSDGVGVSWGPLTADDDYAFSIITSAVGLTGTFYAVPVQRVGEIEFGQEYALPQMPGGTMTHLQVVVPETARFPVTLRMSAGTLEYDDIDMYYELGAEASWSSEYASYFGEDGSEEAYITEPGTWHVMLDHYQWGEGRSFVAQNGPAFWTGFINCEEP